MMKSFDFSKATFGNQFNGFDGFNQGMSPNENGLNTKQIDYNIGIGGVYSYAPAAHKNLYAGFSAFNITRPNISFYDGIAVFSDDIRDGIKGSWSMLPSILFQSQGNNREIVVGSFVKYSLYV